MSAAQEAPTEDSAVRLVGVTKSFVEGDAVHRVLRGVELGLRPGEHVALLGSSGSGKSTLLDIVGGLEPADSGEVWVAGQRLDRMSETERTLLRRRHIGIVFQAFHLIPTLTVLENVLLGLDLDGRADREADARARELLANLGLAGRESSFPDRLSGGEQQRVACARALVHAPALVLADEPTGNLDEPTAAALLDALFELLEREGSSLLMVTHSAAAAARCKRILELTDLMADAR